MIGPVEVMMVGETSSRPGDDVASVPSAALSSNPLLAHCPPQASSSTPATWSVGHQSCAGSSGGDDGEREEVLMGVSRKGHPKLFIGNYSYVQTRSRHAVPASEANSWRCYKMHCRGRVVKVNSGSFVLRHPHTCDNNFSNENATT